MIYEKKIDYQVVHTQRPIDLTPFNNLFKQLYESQNTIIRRISFQDTFVSQGEKQISIKTNYFFRKRWQFCQFECK